MKIERRIFTDGFECRAADPESGTIGTISGHGAVFNSRSEDLGGFYETIEPGAFDDVLDNDVRALWNHDANYLLGRTTSGTLRIGVDEQGLTYEVDLPDTQQARDLFVSMQRGDVTQSSFAFTIDLDDWQERDGMYWRTIKKVGRLFDVSPVTYPAYPDADVGLRSLAHFKHELEAKKKIDFERELAFRKAQLKIRT